MKRRTFFGGLLAALASPFFVRHAAPELTPILYSKVESCEPCCDCLLACLMESG